AVIDDSYCCPCARAWVTCYRFRAYQWTTRSSTDFTNRLRCLSLAVETMFAGPAPSKDGVKVPDYKGNADVEVTEQSSAWRSAGAVCRPIRRRDGRVGAQPYCRDHRACWTGRWRRPDGAHGAGHRLQAQPDEAIDGCDQQVRRRRWRRLPRRQEFAGQSE